MRIHHMDCIRFCNDTSFWRSWRMGKIIGKRKMTMAIKGSDRYKRPIGVKTHNAG